MADVTRGSSTTPKAVRLADPNPLVNNANMLPARHHRNINASYCSREHHGIGSVDQFHSVTIKLMPCACYAH